MFQKFILALCAGFLSIGVPSVVEARSPDSAVTYSRAQIEGAKQRLVDQSIASYSGNCPCPYNRARNGSRCGKRSAYSRPGGASPLCYVEDVTDERAIRFLRDR